MDLTSLSTLYRTDAPVASCYLDTTWDTEDAERAVALRWRALRDRLRTAGVDPATVKAMDGAVADDRPSPGGHGLVLFASRGRVLATHHLPAPPRAELADPGPLPHAMPLVLQLAETVPHVLVATTRVGADITAYGPNGDSGVQRHVEGESDEVTKHRAGGFRGWSQHRYAQRVENAWEHNAKQVATEVDRLVTATGSRVLLVGGDVRARTALRGHLGKRSLAVLAETEGCDRRDARTARDSLTAESRRLLADVTRAGRDEVVSRFAREREHAGRATEGLARVTDAVRAGQVSTVLLHEDALGDATLWVGREPSHCATDAGALRATGVTEPRRVRADAALLRALVATQGSLVPVPVPADDAAPVLPLADGVGALLRYA